MANVLGALTSGGPHPLHKHFKKGPNYCEKINAFPQGLKVPQSALVTISKTNQIKPLLDKSGGNLEHVNKIKELRERKKKHFL